LRVDGSAGRHSDPRKPVVYRSGFIPCRPQDALRDLKDLALARGMSMSTTIRPDKSVDVEFVPNFSTQLTINLPPGVAKAVVQILEDTGDTPGGMFAKALGLYLLALRARKEGKVVGSASSPDSLDTEFTGF
jgi:hypothetical protein